MSYSDAGHCPQQTWQNPCPLCPTHLFWKSCRYMPSIRGADHYKVSIGPTCKLYYMIKSYCRNLGSVCWFCPVANRKCAGTPSHVVPVHATVCCRLDGSVTTSSILHPPSSILQVPALPSSSPPPSVGWALPPSSQSPSTSKST